MGWRVKNAGCAQPHDDRQTSPGGAGVYPVIGLEGDMMLKLKNRFVSSLFAAALVLSLSNCASGPRLTTIELTPNLITELGMENMEKYAYYISKDIELARKDYLPASEMRFQAGDVLRTDKSLRENIHISSKIQGAETFNVFMQLEFVNYHVLGIEFEEDSDVKVGFAVDLRDPEGRFYLQFDDDATRTLRYGAYDYYVKYSGKERPCLMIKIGRNVVQESLRRKAQGKRFE